MRVTISVRIDSESGDNQLQPYSGGSMNFTQDASFSGAGFSTVSKVFTRCHDLLEVLKIEHAQKSGGTK